MPSQLGYGLAAVSRQVKCFLTSGHRYRAQLLQQLFSTAIASGKPDWVSGGFASDAQQTTPPCVRRKMA